MPSSVADRLLQFLKYKSMTLNELGVKLGYRSKEKLYRLERDADAKPGYDTILDIGNFFPELSLEWWLTGRGNMMQKGAEKSLGRDIAERTGITDAEKITLLARLLDSTLDENTRLRDDLKLFSRILEPATKEKGEKSFP